MIPLPTNSKIIKKEGNKAIFQIEGLYPGYGTTIGNCLRRVLLSSLEGTAITQIKIKGVGHEFSTLPGVLEDVITIVLNLKQLRFKSFFEEPQKAEIKVKGEKKVTGSDIKLPSQVELINKKQHIATLTDKKAELDIELTIEKGLGYVPANKEKSEKLEIGQIITDAIFTPIRLVNFKVENMRVGKRTDFDLLLIEVETDGTIEPEEALDQASKILVDHFSSIIINEEILTQEKEVKEIPVEENENEEEDVRKLKIEEIGLSSRITNILIKNGIKTVGGLLKKNKESILEFSGMGDKAMEEIEKKIKKMNLEF